MATIHIMLQSKGGVGKSMSMIFLAQYFRRAGIKTVCYDTDPLNPTFSNVGSLDVIHHDIMAEDKVDSRRFDDLNMEIDQISDPETQVLIDNGAPSFLDISSYLLDNGTFDIYIESGHHVFIHTVISGGVNYRETFNSFVSLGTQFPGIPIVVWQNQFHGPLKHGVKPVSGLKVVKDRGVNVQGVVHIPAKHKDTYAPDIEKMHEELMTFDDVERDEKVFNIYEKNRLKRYGEEVFSAISEAGL